MKPDLRIIMQVRSGTASSRDPLLFAIFDVFWVSRLGKEAVAVVGLTESVMTLIYAVAIGTSIAATAIVARRIGEKDPASAFSTSSGISPVITAACGSTFAICGRSSTF